MTRIAVFVISNFSYRYWNSLRQRETRKRRSWILKSGTLFNASLTLNVCNAIFVLSIALGFSVHEFDDVKGAEVIEFRRNIFSFVSEIFQERDSRFAESQALYKFPPEIESSPELPQNLEEKLENGMIRRVQPICPLSRGRIFRKTIIGCDRWGEAYLGEGAVGWVRLG